MVRKIRLALILLFIFNLFTLDKINSQEAQLSSKKITQFSIKERDNLFLQALSVLPEHKIPSEFRSLIPEPTPIKCATMIVEQIRQNLDIFNADQQAVLNKILKRPNLPLSYVNSTGRFKIHYAITGPDAVSIEDLDNSGIPDFVEEVARAFENSHNIEVNVLGYQAPPDDAGMDGPEYDVYIENLGSAYYGVTTAEIEIVETQQNDFSSFIRIDNDFSQHFTLGIPGAQVTAAHEYFHAIQFGYRSYLYDNEPFYYELCSVWMEDVVYDDINDYYQYLPIFFRRTDIPFNMFDNVGHYLGEALWDHFIVKKYKDINVIRRTWESMLPEVPVLEAIDEVLQIKGSSFIYDFSEFAIWNYFTGRRADAINFYDESEAYREIILNGEFNIASDISIVDSSLSLTHKYYKFTTLVSGEFSISGQLEDPASWMFGTIVTKPGFNPTFHIFSLWKGLNFGFLPGSSEIVVIPINIQILDREDLPSLGSKDLTFNFNLKLGSLKSPVKNGISEIYPNPFKLVKHQKISFLFIISENENVEIRIFSSDGRIVKTTNLKKGTSFYSWNGLNMDGELVPSGIYIVQIKQGNFIDTKKFAVLRP